MAIWFHSSCLNRRIFLPFGNYSFTLTDEAPQGVCWISSDADNNNIQCFKDASISAEAKLISDGAPYADTFRAINSSYLAYCLDYIEHMDADQRTAPPKPKQSTLFAHFRKTK